MSPDKIPLNLFDLALLAVLVAGLVRGRKHGMSEELMELLKWLAVLFGCAVAYEPGGHFLADTSPISLLTSYVIVYIVAALAILALFALFRHSLGGKLLGSDFFGRTEYYFGMISGMVRFTCMLLVGLALLNARYTSPQEVKAMERYQNDVYGSDFFPGLYSVQSSVFEKSLSGPWIKQNLDFLLIKPTHPDNKALHQKDANLPY
jgi:uncharacterized membrane protein required for colicin V production